MNILKYIIYIYILYNIYIHGKTTFHLTQHFQGSKTSSQSRQMYNKKKNNRQFLSYMGPNVKKNVHFWLFYSYLGGPGGPLCRTQCYQIFRAVRSHHRADKFITRKKNNHQFFIYGPQCKKNAHFGLFGGPWVAQK